MTKASNLNCIEAFQATLCNACFTDEGSIGYKFIEIETKALCIYILFLDQVIIAFVILEELTLDPFGIGAVETGTTLKDTYK